MLENAELNQKQADANTDVLHVFCHAFLMFQCGRKAHAFFVHSESLLVNSGSGSLKLPLLSQFLRSQTHKSTESKVFSEKHL